MGVGAGSGRLCGGTRGGSGDDGDVSGLLPGHFPILLHNDRPEHAFFLQYESEMKDGFPR